MRRVVLEERPPAPRDGWGVHCREGIVVFEDGLRRLVVHERCQLSACPCRHHRGTPIAELER